MKISRWSFSGFVFLLLLPAAAVNGSMSRMNNAVQPAYFIENAGQLAPEVQYYLRGSTATFFFTSGSIVLMPPGSCAEEGMEPLVISFIGQNPWSALAGRKPRPERVNFFRGNDPSQWRHNVAVYESIEYRELYPEISLRIFRDQAGLKYEFELAAGADPSCIRMAVASAGHASLTPAGDLQIDAGWGWTEDSAPVSYQEIGGQRSIVPMHFTLQLLDGVTGTGYEIGLVADGPIAGNHPLTIDPDMVPVLSYATFIGGSGSDACTAVKTAPDGSVYVAGWTDSTDFPTASPLFRRHAADDGFISKLNPQGSQLIFSTYFGGSDSEDASGVTIDAAGDVYVTGYTASNNFPTMLPLQSQLAGPEDAFLLKLRGDGQELLFSTYLGGSSQDLGYGVAAAADGVVVMGQTYSDDYPLCNPLRSLYANAEIFIAKFSLDGQTVVYSTYLGGNDTDTPGGVAVREDGSAFVCGTTASSDFPLANPFQDHKASETTNAFLSVLGPLGDSLLFSTYLGGSWSDGAYCVALSQNGDVYLAGVAASTDFPTLHPFQPAKVSGGWFDGFVAKFIGVTGQLAYATYLGGSDGFETIYAIAVTPFDEAVVAGVTRSPDFPQVNPLQAYGGLDDAFITMFSPDGQELVYSTFLGGTSVEGAYGVSVGADSSVYVAGYTESTGDFPVKQAFQPENGGGVYDGFIAKISLPERWPVSLELGLNQEYFRPGDHLQLTRVVRNTGIHTYTADEYIVLDISSLGAPAPDCFYFWPSWTNYAAGQSVALSPESEFAGVVLDFLWPPGSDVGLNIKFWGALIEPDSMQLAGSFSVISFGYGP